LQTGATGNENDTELDRAMGSDKTPEIIGKIESLGSPGDCADQQAVLRQNVKRQKAKQHSAGKGQEGDPNIVGHNQGRRAGAPGFINAEPPFFAVPNIGDNRLDTGNEERRAFGITIGNHEGQHSRQKEHQERCQRVGPGRSKGLWEGGRKKSSDGAERRGAAAIDFAVAAGDQVVEIIVDRVARKIAAGDGQIGGSLAIEPTKLLNFGGGEKTEPAACFIEQGGELFPVRPFLVNKIFGKHTRIIRP